MKALLGGGAAAICSCTSSYHTDHLYTEHCTTLPRTNIVFMHFTKVFYTQSFNPETLQMLKTHCRQFSSLHRKWASPSHGMSLPEPLPRVTMDSQRETSRTLTIFILRDKAHRPGYLTLFYHCRPLFNSMCLFLHSSSDPFILAQPCFISLRSPKNSTLMAPSLCLRAARQAWEVMALMRTAQLIDLSHQNSLYQGAQGVKWMFAGYKSQALTPK